MARSVTTTTRGSPGTSRTPTSKKPQGRLYHQRAPALGPQDRPRHRRGDRLRPGDQLSRRAKRLRGSRAARAQGRLVHTGCIWRCPRWRSPAQGDLRRDGPCRPARTQTTDGDGRPQQHAPVDSSPRCTIGSIARGVLIECEGEGCGTTLYAVFPDIAQTFDGLEVPTVEPLAVPDSAKRVNADETGIAVCPMCQTANRVLD